MAPAKLYETGPSSFMHDDGETYPAEVFKFLGNGIDGEDVTVSRHGVVANGYGQVKASTHALHSPRSHVFKMNYGHLNHDRTLDGVKLSISDFPEELRDALEEMAHQAGGEGHKTGFVDGAELVMILKMHQSLLHASSHDTIPIAVMPYHMHDKLKIFDKDGNGSLDREEIMAAAHLYHQAKQRNRRLLILVGVCAFIMVLMLGAISGLVYAVVEGTKETHTNKNSGVMSSSLNETNVGLVGFVDPEEVNAQKLADKNNQLIKDLKNGKVPVTTQSVRTSATDAAALYSLDDESPTAFLFELTKGTLVDEVWKLCEFVTARSAHCLNRASASSGGAWEFGNSQLLVKGTRAEIENIRDDIHKDARCDPEKLTCSNKYNLLAIQELASLDVLANYVVSDDMQAHDADAHRRRLAAVRQAMHGLTAENAGARRRDLRADGNSVSLANGTWGLDRIGHDEDAPTSLGENVHIFVLDSGVDFGHSDLEGRKGTVLDFTVDDGTGFANQDMTGHGTMMASVVAGKEYGLAPSATVHSYKIVSTHTSPDAKTATAMGGLAVMPGLALRNAVAALHNHVSKLPKTERAVALIGAIGPRDKFANQIVQELVAAGVPVAVAAGNEDADACQYSPASATKEVLSGKSSGGMSTTDATYPVLTVAATQIDNTKSLFSNWGSCVSLWAPGTSVMAAKPFTTSDRTLFSGTSPAAAFVAGVMAIALQMSPSASALDVNNMVMATALSNQVHHMKATHISGLDAEREHDEEQNVAMTANKLLHLPDSMQDFVVGSQNAKACTASAYTAWVPSPSPEQTLHECPPRGTLIMGPATTSNENGMELRRPLIKMQRTCNPSIGDDGKPTCDCAVEALQHEYRSCVPQSSTDYYRYTSKMGLPASIVWDVADLTGHEIFYKPIGDGHAYSISRNVLPVHCDGPELPYPNYHQHSALHMSGGSDSLHMLSLEGSFQMFGKSYDSVIISKNGYISFGDASPRQFPTFPSGMVHESEQKARESAMDIYQKFMFTGKREDGAMGEHEIGLAALFVDLEATSGHVFFGIETEGNKKRAVVTYSQMAAWGVSLPMEGNQGLSSASVWKSTFQIILELDGPGVIRVAYKSVQPRVAKSALVGLRSGMLDFAQMKTNGWMPVEWNSVPPTGPRKA